MTRDYYNRRVGKDGDLPKLTSAETAELIAEAYPAIDGHGYLQRAVGRSPTFRMMLLRSFVALAHVTECDLWDRIEP